MKIWYCNTCGMLDEKACRLNFNIDDAVTPSKCPFNVGFADWELVETEKEC